MWRPPCLKCGDPSEALTKLQVGGGGQHPTKEYTLSQVRGHILTHPNLRYQ